MASKKDPDEIKITLICDLIVSEKAWKDLMKKHGRDMSGVVVGSHVQHAGKTILKKKFEEMGFPQPQIPDYQ